jgi:hypothetical protein
MIGQKELCPLVSADHESNRSYRSVSTSVTAGPTDFAFAIRPARAIAPTPDMALDLLGFGADCFFDRFTFIDGRFDAGAFAPDFRFSLRSQRRRAASLRTRLTSAGSLRGLPITGSLSHGANAPTGIKT